MKQHALPFVVVGLIVIPVCALTILAIQAINADGGSKRAASVAIEAPLVMESEISDPTSEMALQAIRLEATEVARIDEGQPGRDDLAPSPASDEIGTAPLYPGGLTDQHLEYLLSAQSFFEAAPAQSRTIIAHGYAARSIATIMRAQGLADFGTEQERAQGFSTKPRYDDEHVFLCDEARFRFRRGEYPVYDRVLELLQAEGDPKDKTSSSPTVLPDELSAALYQLADTAMQCFDTKQ